MNKNSKKRWRLYDIKYKDFRVNAPSEIIVNLDGYTWSSSIHKGLGNLNSKTYKAILEETGYESTSCKVDVFYLD